MLLFTIQPRWVYDQLAAGEAFVSKPRQDPDSWLNDPEGWYGPERPNMTLFAYDWLCEQMVQRGLQRPAPEAYPVWAYRLWYGQKLRRPDLRYSGMKNWSKGQRSVLMDIEVPDDQVLLSDYDAWHAPLNYWFLARPREMNAFERRCKQAGTSAYRDKPLRQPQLHCEVLQSWQQIFDIEQACRLMGSKKSNQCVQATFWRLCPQHVVRAVEFGAGKPKTELPALLQPPYTGL